MIKDIKLPIEYYGIDEECNGKRFIVEKEFTVLDRKIDEIVRVYGEIIKSFSIEGKDIRGSNVIYILANLSLTIEYIDNDKGYDLSVIEYNTPVYFSVNDNKDSIDNDLGIFGLYVNNYYRGKIYIYAIITVY